MDYSPLPADATFPRWRDRLRAVIEVLLLSGILSSFVTTLVFSFLYGKNANLMSMNATIVASFVLMEAGILLLLLVFILTINDEAITGLGLHWRRWKFNLILGLGLVPCFFFINGIAALVFKIYLPEYYTEQNPLVEIIQTPQQLALFIFSALVAGGIKEELQRAFILNRFRRYLGGAWVGLVIWSLAFGAGHYVQGVQGIVIASLYGFVFGITYILSGSLMAPIVAHSVYDTLALLAYWFVTKSNLAA